MLKTSSGVSVALNLVEVQDLIFSTLESAIPQPLVEQGIPDADTVRKENGLIVPYVALQFGDLQDVVSGRGFTGVRTNNYDLPVYIQVCAADPTVARKIANGPVLNAMLGATFPWTGELRKRPGGGMWPITNSNGATEAYLFPSSWAARVQIADV